MRKLATSYSQHRSWNLAAPSSTVHEEGGPVDVGQGGTRHGGRNWQVREDDRWNWRQGGQHGQLDGFFIVNVRDDLRGGVADDGAVVEVPPTSKLQVEINAHNQLLQKRQRQYEFIGHKNNEKEIVGDEKLCTLRRGRRAMASIPRQKTQRGVVRTSFFCPADGGDFVDLLQLHSGQSKDFQGDPLEVSLPRLTICFSTYFDSMGL